MEWTAAQLGELFPSLTAQMRGSLSNLILAAREALPEEEREASPEKDRKAALMDQSYYVLLRLVENLSSVGWLTGARKPHWQPCEIVRLVSDICVETADLVQDQNRTMTFALPPLEYPCMIDPEAIRTALYQLLSNALKFTPEGGWIRVELRIHRGQAMLSVSNSGDGIPGDLLDFLMDSGPSPNRMAPPPRGLGLGLPLCQAIAEAHGGRMLAESLGGDGCRITLAMPCMERCVPRDVLVEYDAGFNRALLGLADALPASAFCLRKQE